MSPPRLGSRIAGRRRGQTGTEAGSHPRFSTSDPRLGILSELTQFGSWSKAAEIMNSFRQ